MRVSELMELTFSDWNSMSERELRKNATILQSAVNKRIKRLTDKSKPKVYSPALEALHAKGIYHFSIKNRTNTEVLEQVREMKNFMSKKTSTRKGAIEAFKKRQQHYKEEFGHDYEYTEEEDYYLSSLIEEVSRRTGGKYKPSEVYKVCEQAIKKKPKSTFDELDKYAVNLLEGIQEDNDNDINDIFEHEEFEPKQFT